MRGKAKNHRVTCRICGLNTPYFKAHLKTHNMSQEEYFNKYIKTENDSCTCVICGKPTKFDIGKEPQPYGNYNHVCSTSCRSTLNNQLAKENWEREHPNEERYNAFKDPKVKEKMRATWMKNYGVDNPTKSKVIKEKVKKTCEEKFGGWYSQTEEYKERVESTNLEKYGAKYYCQTEEHINRVKETCLEKYGSTCFLASEEGKQKVKETFLERFGVDNPIKAAEVQEKVYNTKKKNGTFNTSNLEKALYETLIEIYGKDDIEREYRDERYKNPVNGRNFRCDFYIKSLDLFIEVQGKMGHGPKPYNKNDKECIEFYHKLEKAIQTYDPKALHTYSISDVDKRKQAKLNNLNYLEIFYRNPREYTKENVLEFIEGFFKDKSKNVWYSYCNYGPYEFDILEQ